ncbi:MAG TPA: right-handed parallel beta-helix repeat-containing protein, partial [Thermoflexales bacterium]|nr:right-handed parallel beta-helix repeat-containing protein [Thermoflexales bacterium]
GPAPLIEAPAAPLAGAFVVNSPLDTNALDSVLTLREAILVANGTLIGDFSPSEQAQLSGCVFNGSGFITGGCGPGITDTISFSSSVVITLTSALPAITDTRGTIIRGCDVEPCAVIESGSIAANTDALTVNGANNEIWGLQIQRSPRDGIRVNGDANALNFLKVYSSADNGVRINGDNNRIFEGYFGFSPADSGQNCHPNRTGILIANGGTGNQVRAALVGCSIQAGIQISGSNLNTIMDDTFVGWRFPVARPNGIGILINNGSFRNEISQTLVAYNLGNGIEIRGANGTSILDSDFLYNGRNGIAIYNASFTSVGGRYLDNNSVNGNEIGGNTRSGIVISGTANANVVLGNQIGARSGTNNGDAGVLITDGAYQNTVGGLRNGPLALGRGGNTIGGNTIGVHLRAGANNNTVWGNDIGRSAGETSPVLNTTGILIEDGVYNTFLGSSSAANYHNVIAGNGTGVVISDANRAFLYGNIIGISPTLGNLGTGLVLHRAVTNT